MALSNVSDHGINLLFAESFSAVDLLMVSDEVVKYVDLIGTVILSCLIGLFGVVANIINIVTFLRMGFRETINISLFALTVSDLAASILLVWTSICSNPLLLNAKAEVSFPDLNLFLGTFPRAVFLTITAFITVFITIERYLCIVYPLMVKQIMTKQRVAAILIAIYVIAISARLPNYFTFRFAWRWDRRRNRTMFGVRYFRNTRLIEMVCHNLQSIFILISFMTVSLCTALFAFKLNQRRKWRQSVSAGKDVTSSVRDQQIIKMVTCVAIVFIACYLPFVILMFSMISNRRIDSRKRYENLYLVQLCVTTVTSGINSSVNIFVYYNMMSKYRAVLLSVSGKTPVLI